MLKEHKIINNSNHRSDYRNYLTWEQELILYRADQILEESRKDRELRVENEQIFSPIITSEANDIIWFNDEVDPSYYECCTDVSRQDNICNHATDSNSIKSTFSDIDYFSCELIKSQLDYNSEEVELHNEHNLILEVGSVNEPNHQQSSNSNITCNQLVNKEINTSNNYTLTSEHISNNNYALTPEHISSNNYALTSEHNSSNNYTLTSEHNSRNRFNESIGYNMISSCKVEILFHNESTSSGYESQLDIISELVRIHLIRDVISSFQNSVLTSHTSNLDNITTLDSYKVMKSSTRNRDKYSQYNLHNSDTRRDIVMCSETYKSNANIQRNPNYSLITKFDNIQNSKSIRIDKSLDIQSCNFDNIFSNHNEFQYCKVENISSKHSISLIELSQLKHIDHSIMIGNTYRIVCWMFTLITCKTNNIIQLHVYILCYLTFKPSYYLELSDTCNNCNTSCNRCYTSCETSNAWSSPDTTKYSLLFSELLSIQGIIL